MGLVIDRIWGSGLVIDRVWAWGLVIDSMGLGLVIDRVWDWGPVIDRPGWCAPCSVYVSASVRCTVTAHPLSPEGQAGGFGRLSLHGSARVSVSHRHIHALRPRGRPT